MATAAGVLKRDAIKEAIFVWEGRDRAGKVIKGEMRAGGKNVEDRSWHPSRRAYWAPRSERRDARCL